MKERKSIVDYYSNLPICLCKDNSERNANHRRLYVVNMVGRSERESLCAIYAHSIVL